MTARITATLALIVFLATSYATPDIRAAAVLTLATLAIGALVGYGRAAA
jgi:hypothetical protein